MPHSVNAFLVGPEGPLPTPEVRHPVHAIRYYPYFRTHSYRPFALSNSLGAPGPGRK